MKMKLNLLIHLLLALVPSLSAMAQGEAFSNSSTSSTHSNWFVANLPDDAIVPGEFILRYEHDMTAQKLKELITEYYNTSVLVRPISSVDFHVKFLKQDIIPSECLTASNQATCLACHLIEGNPGGGGPFSKGDGVWPNYYVSSGAPTELIPEYETDGEPSILYNTFDSGFFNPLNTCGNYANIPYAEIGNTPVSIAILDSGINTSKHTNFFEPDGTTYVNWQSLNWMLDYPNDYPQVAGEDPYGHGTAVSFMAAAPWVNQNKQQQLEIISYRVLGDDGRGTIAHALRALNQAIDYGADVINMSFGFKGLECDTEESDLLLYYLTYAYKEGALVFTSAGNDGNDLSQEPQLPAAENFLPSTYTIGASTCSYTVPWDHSNISTQHVDLMAPGYQLTVPFVPADNANGYILIDGTSFAAPLVAGMAGTYLSNTTLEQTICYLESADAPVFDEAIYVSRIGSIFILDPSSCDVILSFSSPEVSTNQTGSSISAPYPNPFTSTLNVTLNVTGEVAAGIHLYNDKGSELYQLEATQTSYSLHTKLLPPGIYFLKITDASGTRIKKVIKH